MPPHGSLANIEKLEADLCEAADNLRANSKLTSSEYCMPVLGIIFLRHAANRFETASRQIAQDQAAGKTPKRKIIAADFVKRRTLFLPTEAHYENILATPTDADLAEVGVAPAEVDDDFDFEQALGAIHVETKDLNQEAADLAKRIQKNFEGLGV